MSFFEFPHARTYDADLGWLIRHMIRMSEKLENFINLNTIKYADPIAWNITTQYEANTVVINPLDGTAYLSTRPVPAGVSITNTDYWTPIFNYGESLNTLREQIAAANEEGSPTASRNYGRGDLVWINNKLYEIITDIAAGTAFTEGVNIAQTTVERMICDTTVRNYPTIAELCAENLSSGNMARTSGYYAVGDGGGAFYVITDTMPAAHYETLDNGLYAELVPDQIGVNIKQVGIKQEATQSATMDAINALIAKSLYHVLIIPADIDYGYDRHSGTVFPDMNGSTIRLLIIDFSYDASYGTDPTSGYGAMQCRFWYKSEYENLGQHDGNGFLVNGDWNPNIKISNNSNASDPFRASLFFCDKGNPQWQIGQGIFNSDQDFAITRFPIVNQGGTVVLAIRKADGNMSIGSSAIHYPLGIWNRYPSIINDGTYLFLADAYGSGQTYTVEKAFLKATMGLATYVNGSLLQEVRRHAAGVVYRFRMGPGGTDMYFKFLSTGIELTNANNSANLMELADGKARFPKGVSGNHFTTPNRPVITEVGAMVYDQSIGKPIWWSGSGWIDASGASV